MPHGMDSGDGFAEAERASCPRKTTRSLAIAGMRESSASALMASFSGVGSAGP